MFKRFSFSEVALAISGYLLFSHVRLVGWTNRITRIPDGSFFEPLEKQPVIVGVWHGEHFLVPFFGWRKDKLNVLVAVHRDGEIVVRAGHRFGLKFVRGSGDHGSEFIRKKALRAFTTMLRLLKRGESVLMTADVPKVSRVAGLGIVTLSKHSGCPIVPVAMVTSRRRRLSNWDRTAISLPFGRMIMVRGEPIHVPRDADEAVLEAMRRTVEERLNAVTAHAYSVADGVEAAALPLRNSALKETALRE
jgi:lysophospholipid acyltransferase (LPLAT)-like uncharacterized protein